MAKTTFVDENPGTSTIGTTFLASWFNKVFGQNGHVHDGQDADGSAPVVHYPTRLASANTSLDKNTDCVVYMDCTGGNRTVSTCHVADVLAGRPFMIKKTDATDNTITITDPDGKTIEGAANLQLSIKGEFVWIAHDGTNWQKIK